MFPIHINLGFNTFYFYEGLYFAIALLVGIAVATFSLKREGIFNEEVEPLLFTSFIAALIGARISHFLFWNFDLFFSDPLQIFMFWRGGMSITGGLIGGFLGGYIYTKRKAMDFWKYFAFISPGLLVAQSVGRIGCFLNGDAYGTYTTLPWGLRFPRFGRFVFGQIDQTYSSPAWYFSNTQGYPGHDDLYSATLHPTQLYEALGNLVILVLVLVLIHQIKKMKKPNYSAIFFLHSGGYALLRFLMEFMRGDREGVVFLNMSGMQLVLLAYAVIVTLVVIQNGVFFSKAAFSPNEEVKIQSRGQKKNLHKNLRNGK
jgi:phosphatidylglycerol:prolipoprotein diacylglycerol transferase